MTKLVYIEDAAGAVQIWSYRDGELRVWWVDDLREAGDKVGLIDIYNRDEDGDIMGYGKEKYDEKKALEALKAIEDDSGLEPCEMNEEKFEEMCDEAMIIAYLERDDI